LDRKNNEEILEEFRVEPVDVKMYRHRSNYARTNKGMNKNRMPKIILIYRPKERKQIGRLLNRLLDEPEKCL
jgi:hypothetical protein